VDETRLAKPSDDRWKAAAEVSQKVNFGPQEERSFALFDGFVFSRTGMVGRCRLTVSSPVSEVSALETTI